MKLSPVKISILALVGMGIVYAISKKRAGEKLNTVFSKLKFGSGKLQLIFLLQNPSSTSIVLNSLVGDLYINGKAISNLTSFQKITIPPNNQVELPITVKPSLTDLVTFLIGLFKNKSKNIEAEFRGNVNAEDFVIPINQKIKVQ